jgi:hypothetical protein
MPAVLLFASLICFLPVAVSPAAAESGVPFADAHTHLLRHLPRRAAGRTDAAAAERARA